MTHQIGLKDDISILEKKVDGLDVEIDNINHYEHGDALVISGCIIHMVHQLKILMTLFITYSGNT